MHSVHLRLMLSLKESLWYCLPLCHKHMGRMCMIGGWGMLIPCMLDEVQIWRIWWPIHPIDVVLPKKVCNNSCTMRSGIVILKHGCCTNMLEHRYDKGLDNLLQIAIPVQVTINDTKRSPITERKAHPNHDTATTKWQTLIDVKVSKSVSRTPVHPFLAVAKL